MLKISDYQISGNTISSLEGRLDGISSDAINAYIAELLDIGRRIIILDFSNVSFISSAGLRVLLSNQKKVTSAGGEIILFRISSNIREVLKLSGFLRIFKIFENEEELNINKNNESNNELSIFEYDNLSMEILKFNKSVGKINIIGDTRNTDFSAYQESDCIAISAIEIANGFGFAAIGSDWDSIKDYFGEAVVIKNNLFVYSAVEKPAVDFMIYSNELNSSKYAFLNGVSISGAASYLISFKFKDSFIRIQDLLEAISLNINLDKFAFNLIAESKGIRGMNLRRIPIKENQPQNGKSIFENENFSDWVNFPINDEHVNSIVLGSGVFGNDNAKKLPIYSSILPKGSNFHLHCGIFEKSFLMFKPDTYNEDLNKIFNELEARKVQHILNGSLLSMGTLEIIILED